MYKRRNKTVECTGVSMVDFFILFIKNNWYQIKEKKFDLSIDAWLNFDKGQFSFRILDFDYKIIKEYSSRIEEQNLIHNHKCLLDSLSIDGKNIFQFFPTFIDKKYLMNCGLALELLYNYWDKVGDLIEH